MTINRSRLFAAHKIFDEWAQEMLATGSSGKNQEIYNIGRYVEKIAKDIEMLIKVWPKISNSDMELIDGN